MVMLALRTRETGHPFLAFWAASSNFAWSAPGTLTFTSRCTLVMVKPASVLSRVKVALVSMLCAVMPAFPSCADSAMEKQPACAAAISSYGLVPAPFSKRVLKEYWVWLRTPLCVETVPFPSFKPPDQWALAVRCIRSSWEASQLYPHGTRVAILGRKAQGEWSFPPGSISKP